MPHVKFDKLSSKTRTRITDRLWGNSEGIVVETSDLRVRYLLLTASILWLILLLYLSNDYLWSVPKAIVLAILSFAAIYLLIQSVSAVVRAWSGLRQGLLITPHYVVEVQGKYLFYWDLDDIVAFDHHHSYQ